MKTWGLLPFIGMIATVGAFAQTSSTNKTNPNEPILIERVIKPNVAEDMTIGYSKYKLSNGLTVIIAEDHSDPLVHVNVTYHVGSAREESGKSGFAHFFEHMMFQGSKDVAGGEQFHIVAAAGGSMNGNTTSDRTRYFDNLPKNYLETGLWLEADRMGFLLDSVTQTKFEVQRATVKNEKGQNYENRPYGLVGENFDKNFYPFGHPYSWPTIGYVPDLNRVGVDDLKKFFLRWYGPNNAVLTIAGDVNTFDALQLVQKYFGSIPRGPEVKRPKAEYFSLDKDRYVSMQDNIRFPELIMGFPSVPHFHEDEAALDILAEILGGGKSSILYKNLVKTQKAVSATCDNECEELAGQFIITIRAMPGTKLSDIEAIVRASIKELLDKGITEEDIAKVKAEKEAETVYSLESVAAKANLLSDYETYLGNPNYIRTDMSRYTNVTKADIMRVFEVYVKAAHSEIMSVYPKGHPELIAAADNFKAGGDSSKLPKYNYDTLKVRTVVDNFNRRKQPKPGPAPVMNVPAHFTLSQPMFMKTTVVSNHEVPDISMQFVIKAGQMREAPGKEGIANLTARMLRESTYKMSAEAMSDALDRIGTRVHIYTDEENITASVMCLTKYFDQTMVLTNEMLMHPRFDTAEFRRVKAEILQQIASQSVQANSLADNAFHDLLYGKGHPYGYSILGTKETVENISLEDVRNYFQTYFTQKNTDLFISGDVDQDRLRNQLMLLAGWPPMETEAAKVPAAQAVEKTKIYLVNKDNAPQSEIRIGYVALPYSPTGDYYKNAVMNYPLGGSFSSRLNLYIREKKGYTYGIQSYFSGNHYTGIFEVFAGIRGNVTDSALGDALDIMKKYHEKGITKDELEFAKGYLGGREALAYETNNQKIAFIQRMTEYGLSDDYVNDQLKLLKKLSKKDINKQAKKYLPMDNMVIVVVGDAKKLKDKLTKLGYDVVDYQESPTPPLHSGDVPGSVK